MAGYDKHYMQENYFGQSYKELIDFFNNLPNKGTVLDLGCGQGIDSIELAKIGYNVLGVDLSKVGIDQMLKKAENLNLNLLGEVSDIYTFDRIGNFDIILLDSMLHFYPKDKVKETGFFNKILNDMKKDSLFCNLLLKSKKNEDYIKYLVKNNNHTFEVVFDGYAKYIEANCEYHMFVIKKI